MKKVFFSAQKAGRNKQRMSGVGYISDEDLLIPAISRNGKAYIRAFEIVSANVTKVPKSPDEYKGTFYEVKEIESKNRNGSIETREVELTYYFWYKLAE